jgi:hypothetical protein
VFKRDGPQFGSGMGARSAAAARLKTAAISARMAGFSPLDARASRIIALGAISAFIAPSWAKSGGFRRFVVSRTLDHENPAPEASSRPSTEAPKGPTEARKADRHCRRRIGGGRVRQRCGRRVPSPPLRPGRPLCRVPLVAPPGFASGSAVFPRLRQRRKGAVSRFRPLYAR